MDSVQPAEGAVAQEPGHGGAPALGLPAFGRALFARVAAEDMQRLAMESLAALTAEVWNRYQTRAPGTAQIGLIELPGVAGITVLEVVNDDMPFLLDSTLAELSERGIEPRLVAHPILAVERDAGGRLLAFHGEATTRAQQRESVLHIHLHRLAAEEAASLTASLARVYADVRQTVADWQPMRKRLAQAVADYQFSPPPLPAEEIEEAIAFLKWIGDDNFTLLGMREYRFPDNDAAADPMEGTGLGILRDPEMRILRRGRELVTMTPEIRAFLTEPQALIITKANVRSLVHRRVHMDYVGVKMFDGSGRLTGELRIAGLMTASAYTSMARSIPYIRRKIEHVLESTGLPPDSHSGRALINVLESYPRDELFQLNRDTIRQFALDILALGERPRVRALTRTDRFDRFVSVLVFVPKERYDTEVRRKIGAMLAEVFAGRLSASYPSYPDGPLARTHFIIGRDGGITPEVARDEIETRIQKIIRTWADSIKEAAATQPDTGAARALVSRYGEAFGAAYREAFSPEQAIADMGMIDALSAERPRLVDLYRRRSEEGDRINLKVYSLGKPVSLSERVPMLEGLGFTVLNERTYRVQPFLQSEASRTYLHDMTLERASGGAIDIEEIAPRVEAALMAIFQGRTEADAYNALILEAGLGWREAAMLRALSRYAQQIRAPFTHTYMAETLKRHAQVTRRLVELFEARFHPGMPDDTRGDRQATISAGIDEILSAVQSLDEDRILRRFRNLVQSAVRTNFYQLDRNGQPQDIIAFKFEAARVEALPLPRPLFEIFLSSPRVEGLHLRFGKVARGGIRWSDRPQDFRTEVLGLVKAQQVKNAVIVPVGAKGGFVPKRLPPASDRAAWLAEGTEAYKLFIGTLLSLTDNIDGEAIVPPQGVVRHDPDDPYLVVAADKGTATFSDTANGISLGRRHWLGDAFASGGSVGYDHKKMGITARGAWEATRRHFREMDIDIQSAPFTVAGVGDMSGDVFGNGMLLSPAIRLVAAFDHRDIFIDPTPDAAAGLKERRRLFDLPRSSWADYDRSLISAGGGVFSRSLKSLPLSPEIRSLLGLAGETATPQEVMNAILKADVDLLWFGGIGTYVRASSETDADAGDKANDAIRVTGRDLRCKVIGEGANLGMTQLARIEAGRKGVRLNTDAIDNSAGVNSSDVEVNIKIALSTPVHDGRLTQEARNELLASMTDEVAALVLRNNYLQSLALSLAQSRGAEDLPYARRLMRGLESEGRLDRAVEYLPTDVDLGARERAGEGLTRPELAVLLAYAKLALHDRILASSAPDDPYFEAELMRYFPAALRGRFPDAINSHRLRREIIATGLANALINRGGPTLLPRVLSGPQQDAGRLAMAYATVREAFGLLDLNTLIDGLDGKIAGALQLSLYRAVQDFALATLGWFVRHGDFAGGLAAAIENHKAGAAAMRAALAAGHPDVTRRARLLEMDAVPAEVAARLAELPLLAAAPDLVLVARRTGKRPAQVVDAHLVVDAALGLSQLKDGAHRLRVSDQYEQLALDRAGESIAEAHRALTARAVATEGGIDVALGAGSAEMAARRKLIGEIAASGLSVAKLSVVAGLLSDLAV
jgi:glutamate dehydrogenase